MNPEHLAALRKHELETVSKLLQRHNIKNGRLLEIGAGTGQQAQMLNSKGYEVSAIDLPQSRYAPARVWPVIEYDGKTIPFNDDSFDIVYSSNVLEHITETNLMQREISRVLAPGGIAIHVLPSPAWRIITMIIHYPWLIATLLRSARKTTSDLSNKNNITLQPHSILSKREYWRRIPYANRHGEHGNALTEAFYFRKTRWINEFENNNFQIQEIIPSGLIYSGYALFGSQLSITSRERLARLGGSACNIFILRHTDDIPL